MLPRLRFIFVAALIAALPWMLLGSGIITTAQNPPVSEQARPSQGVTIAAGDLRDARHMHALAFVRRSRELERLRELASAPLSDWIATPAGLSSSDAATGEASDEAISGREAASTPQTQTVASLPVAPAVADEPATTPPPATPEPAERDAAMTPAATEDAQPPAQDAVKDAAAAASLPAEIKPDLSRVDWSKVTPPLPRARVGEDSRKTATRRRAKRYRHVSQLPQAQPYDTSNPFGLYPDPFAGPPATATINSSATTSTPQ